VEHAQAIELGRALGQAVLVTDEVGGDAGLPPYRPLLGQRAVRGAADHVTARLGCGYQGKRDRARRIACLERAVDVEAEQDPVEAQGGQGLKR